MLSAAVCMGLFAGVALGAMPAPAAKSIAVCNLAPLAQGDLNDVAFRRRAWDDLHLAGVLQGLVNRSEPRLYVTFVGADGKIDRFWWEKMRAPGQWLADRAERKIEGIEGLVGEFRRDIRGVVVWDERVPATSNLASTICGVESAVPVRYDPAPGSLYHRLVEDPAGPRMPVLARLLNADGSPLFTGQGTIPGTSLASTGSAKCDAYLWAIERYLKTKRCNPKRLAYYPDAFWLKRTSGVGADRTLLCNHDFFVARKAFFFDLSPWDDEAADDDPTQQPGTDYHTLTAMLRAAYDGAKGGVIHVGGFVPWDQKYTMHTGAKHDGVPSEWRYAEILSCFNAYMDADAPGLHAMANASVYALFPLKKRYPQPNLPTEQTLRAKGLLDAQGHVAAKTFVTIYVGDYDAASWVYERMPDLWTDPVRGSIPLGWAVNPNLADRFGFGLDYLRRTASANDTFIAGDSGAGYLNPGNLVPPRKWSGLPSGLQAWEEHNKRYFAQWGLSIVGFVIDGYAPGMSDEVKQAYARFSPGGVVAQKIPEQSLVDGVPFLRMASDLTGTSEEAANLVARDAPKSGPAFRIYRTILWSPEGHKRLFDRLRELRPDIQVVEPHTLMLLLKKHLEGKQG